MIPKAFTNLKELVNVGYFETQDGAYPSPHLTEKDSVKVELILKGCILFDDGTEEIECPLGSLFWHLPGEGTIHKYKPGEPYACLVLQFAMKGKISRDFPRFTFWNRPVEVQSFAKEALRCYYDDGYDRSVLCQFLYSTMYWKAYHYSKTEISPDVPKEVKNAIAWIKGNSSKNISVNDMAEAVEISVPHLHTLFKQHVKDTPHNYLVMRRMQQARNMLATTNLPIKQICSKCGFVNIENFCRRFKNYTKMTPGQYRSKHSVEA